MYNLDETTYRLLVLGGSWLAGIGSLAAVITSLWLARRGNSIRLGISASHVQIITPGVKGTPDYVQIRVVNKGFRPVKITSVGWRIGFFKKAHAVQLFGDINSETLPKMLNEGEEVTLLVKFNDNFDDDWIVRFPKNFLYPSPKWKILSMRLVVFTSVGQSFKRKIEKSLRKSLIKAAETCS